VAGAGRETQAGSPIDARATVGLFRFAERSELIGNDEVRIVDGSGTTIAQRLNPRAAFRGLARLTWDALDFTYFAGYALWNYLTTPFLLVYKDVHVGALDPLDGLSRLRVTFPDEIPTHSRRQIFYFDNRRRLRRLDYAVDIVSRRVRGAHFCDEYKTFDGLAAPTRRRVLPLLIGNAPLPGPTLVAIDIHSIEWRAR